MVHIITFSLFKGETNLKFIWYAFSHANRGLKSFNNNNYKTVKITKL